MPMETLMTKAAAAKAARTHRTVEMYGVQAAATSASSCDASSTAGGRTVIMIRVRWSARACEERERREQRCDEKCGCDGGWLFCDRSFHVVADEDHAVEDWT
eukprot:6214349-Pleurochrysis_carterae.AAC.1